MSKIWVAVTAHSGTSDEHFAVKSSYEEAVDVIHEHFLCYDLIVKDGKPFDPDCSSDEEGFKAVEGTMHNGKVASFVHAGGDGPIGYIKESQ